MIDRNERIKDLIIRPTDSLNLIWSGDVLERLQYNNKLYKFCNFVDGHWVPEENFKPWTKSNDKLKGWCVDCRKKYNKGNKERALAKPHLLEAQDYLCGMCFRDLRNYPSQHIHVDHNHRTDVTRGVLCRDCNLGSGLLKTKETMLRGYLWEKDDGAIATELTFKDKLNLARSVLTDIFK